MEIAMGTSTLQQSRMRSEARTHMSRNATRSIVSTHSFVICLLITLVVFCKDSNACYLQGTDSGECTLQTMDPVWRSTFMPFCFDAITYPACIPKYQTLPPSREFPDGRWFNNTVRNKDDWIGSIVPPHIARRIGYEMSAAMKEANYNEFGDLGHTRRRFRDRPDCQLAYKNYFCWINFPRCDITRDLTLPTCRSACENFFRTCGYEKGLWRCGKSKWFNGYEPEIPQLPPGGNRSYLREFMTGQPFRQNKYTQLGAEIPICTPAILGAASHGTGSSTARWITAATAILVSIISLIAA